jgi:hypothetical protein
MQGNCISLDLTHLAPRRVHVLVSNAYKLKLVNYQDLIGIASGKCYTALRNAEETGGAFVRALFKW